MPDRSRDLVWFGCCCAESALALSTLRLEKRDRGFAPIRYLALYALVADVVTKGMQLELLDAAPRPYAGAARALFTIETLLLTGWPMVLATAFLWVFVPTRRGAALWAPAGAWLWTNLAMMVAYPMGHPTHERTLLGIELAFVFLAIVVTIVTWLRRWAGPHQSMLYLAGAEAVVATVGPYARNIFTDWKVATMLYAVSFGVLAIRHLWLGRARRAARSAIP